MMSNFPQVALLLLVGVMLTIASLILMVKLRREGGIPPMEEGQQNSLIFGMIFGAAVGIVIGLLVFDNPAFIGIGAGCGTSIGMVIAHRGL